MRPIGNPNVAALRSGGIKTIPSRMVPKDRAMRIERANSLRSLFSRQLCPGSAFFVAADFVWQ